MKAFTSCLSHLESLVLSLIHLAIGECNRTQDASEDSGFTMDGEWVKRDDVLTIRRDTPKAYTAL